LLLVLDLQKIELGMLFSCLMQPLHLDLRCSLKLGSAQGFLLQDFRRQLTFLAYLFFFWLQDEFNFADASRLTS
jgi:hypothetical protein